MHIILDGVFDHCGAMFEPFQDEVRKGDKSAYKDWFLARSYPLTTVPLNYLTRGCTPDAMAQARQVAARLDIPFYVVDA